MELSLLVTTEIKIQLFAHVSLPLWCLLQVLEHEKHS